MTGTATLRHTASASASDALTARMNAVLDLLVAAGTDTVDNSMLERHEGRCRLDFARSLPLPLEAQPFDQNVERLTEQLHDCLQEAPERQKVEALDPSEPRQLTSYSNHTAGGGRRASKAPKPPKEPNMAREPKEQRAAALAQPASTPAPQPENEEGIDRRSALERELSETSYPKIGPGYSDSISVVSDLTTPTVVAGVHIPEEEHYDRGPPLQIGVSAKPGRKERDRLSTANRRSSRSVKPNHLQQRSRQVREVPPAPSPTQPPPMPPPPTPVQQRRSSPEVSVPERPIVQQQSQQTNMPPQSPPQRRRSGGAAAQRRQSHMAIIAQLQHTQPVVPSGPAPSPSGSAVRSKSFQPGHVVTPPTAASGKHPRARSMQPTVPKTVNDFPSLNSKASQFDNDTSYGSEEYGRPANTGPNGKRRSLLRISNKYAPSVSTASSRMLLNSSQAKTTTSKTTTSKSRPYGLMRRRGTADLGKSVPKVRSKPPTASMEALNRGHGDSASNGNINIDLDGVLSTMGQDIDYIFRELNALEGSSSHGEASSPTRRGRSSNTQALPVSESGVSAVNESNLGSTAKIKYTLGSVARTLRTDEGGGDIGTADKSGATPGSKEKRGPKPDPLLIDEDGFIISEEKGFSEDPFASKNGSLGASRFSQQSSLANRDRRSNNGTGRRNTMNMAPSTRHDGRAPDHERRRASIAHGVSAQTPHPDSADRETRIDAVEVATKNRIDMLRKLVHQRSERFGSNHSSLRGGEDALNNKLDFVEAETMKQIGRLRTRLGESHRGGLTQT